MIAQDQQSRVFCELCALLLSILEPPLLSASCSNTPNAVAVSSTSPAPARLRRSKMSPAAFASLLLGISLALILCGSVTFVIGFILMPWVLGMLVAFYFLGLVSNVSGLWRATLLGGNSHRSEAKGMPGKLSKLPIL